MVLPSRRADRGNSNPRRILSVYRFPNGEATEWLDESGIHRRSVSRRGRSKPRNWSDARRTTCGTMTRAAAIAGDRKWRRQRELDKGLLSPTILRLSEFFLACIRTSLAFMGFRGVVTGFGLYPHQFQTPTYSVGTVERAVALVRHSADRSWSSRECFCRMAPPPIGPGVGSRRNRTLSSLHAPCRDCFLSGPGRIGNGDLDFRPRFREFAICKS